MFLGSRGPAINPVSNIDPDSIRILMGKLRITKNIGQVLYEFFSREKGFNPSMHTAKDKPRWSSLNAPVGPYHNRHASEWWILSTRCWGVLKSGVLWSCSKRDISLFAKRRRTLSSSGEYLNLFLGIRVLSLYRSSSHFEHLDKCEYSPIGESRKMTQSLIQQW